MVRDRPQTSGNRPLSTRKALLFWFGCALAGWVVAIFSIYGVLQFGDRVIAVLTDPNDVRVTDQEERSLQEVAPAAGNTE